MCSESKVYGEEIARLESAKALLASAAAISASSAGWISAAEPTGWKFNRPSKSRAKTGAMILIGVELNKRVIL